MMMQYAADPSSSVAASCDQVHKDLVTAVHNEQHMCPVQVQLRCAEHQRKHNCVLDVLTLVAYGGC